MKKQYGNIINRKGAVVVLAALLLLAAVFCMQAQKVQAKTIEYNVLSHTMATEEEFEAVKELYIPRVQNDGAEAAKKVSYGAHHKTMQFQMKNRYADSGCKIDITDAVEDIKLQTADATEKVTVGITAEISARSEIGGFGFLMDDGTALEPVTLGSAYVTAVVEKPLEELAAESYETLYMGFYANDPSIYIRNIRVYYYFGERELPAELTPVDSPAGANRLILHDLGSSYPARSNFYEVYKNGTLTTEKDAIRFEADRESAVNGIRMDATSFVSEGVSGCTFGAALRIKAEGWRREENQDNKALLFFEVTGADGSLKERVILGSYEPDESLKNLTNDVNDIGEDWSTAPLRGQNIIHFEEGDTVYLCVNQKNTVHYYDEVCLWYYKDNELTATSVLFTTPFFNEEDGMVEVDVENLTVRDEILTIEVKSYDADTVSGTEVYRMELPAGYDRRTVSIPAVAGNTISCYGEDGTYYLEDYAVESQIWIGTWGSSQLTASGDTLPPEPGLENNTYRQAVRVSVGGDFVRLKFSNEFGERPLTLESVHIAQLLTAGLSEIDPSTDTIVTFDGNAGITIPAGETIVSDVIPYSFDALEYIAVTAKFGEIPYTLTSHTASRSTNWLIAGTHVTDAELVGASTATSWYFLSDIETLADTDTRAVVCFGDSITDGYGATTDYYNRWTDKLAEALQENEATQDVAVVNRGIGGNSIWGGNGPSGKLRFTRDVLNTEGVGYVIILIGVNDIGYASSDITEGMAAQYTAWVEQCHERGIKVYAGTILPFKGNAYYTEYHEELRVKINEWICSAEAPFDAVIDFAAAMTSDADAEMMIPAYSTDYLHPNAAGYEFMAELIDLTLFE